MLLTSDQVDRLETDALRLLEDVGLFVETERVAALMCKRGCKPLPNGRLHIPREQSWPSNGSASRATRRSCLSASPQNPLAPSETEMCPQITLLD